jgi:uncharacterized protein DUF5996
VNPAWPTLPVADWADTRDTLHMWTQVVGKIRVAHSPLLNHWWNSTLYVSATGLSTALMHYDAQHGFQMGFDFNDDNLHIVTTAGAHRSVALEPRTVADFYAEVMAHLDELGLSTPIWTMPVEVEGAIPFDEDDQHKSYDRDAVRRFHQSLVSSERLLQEFRARFVGKTSPVHFFWGGFDLAETRFSGRRAPRYPRKAQHCGSWVMEEAYSHEVSSAGYWPFGRTEGLFYSYAYPEPDGFEDFPIGPAGASYDSDMGEYVLPYEVVRTADDPDRVLSEFFQSTYEAAAERGGWDRGALERPG